MARNFDQAPEGASIVQSVELLEHQVDLCLKTNWRRTGNYEGKAGSADITLQLSGGHIKSLAIWRTESDTATALHGVLRRRTELMYTEAGWEVETMAFRYLPGPDGLGLEIEEANTRTAITGSDIDEFSALLQAKKPAMIRIAPEKASRFVKPATQRLKKAGQAALTAAGYMSPHGMIFMVPAYRFINPSSDDK